MEEEVQNMLAAYCACIHCNQLMSDVVVNNGMRYCKDCAISLIKEKPDEWSLCQNSGQWSRIAKLYLHYVKYNEVRQIEDVSPVEREESSNAEKLKEIEDFLETLKSDDDDDGHDDESPTSDSEPKSDLD